MSSPRFVSLCGFTSIGTTRGQGIIRVVVVVLVVITLSFFRIILK